MRLPPLAVVLLCGFPLAATAITVDPKALARFDYSYAKCEAAFPEMKGARDEAYLSLWRIKADAKERADLAAARKGAPYQAEAKRARDDDAKTPAKKETLDQQCKALWGETRRVRQGG